MSLGGDVKVQLDVCLHNKLRMCYFDSDVYLSWQLTSSNVSYEIDAFQLPSNYIDRWC